MGDTRAHKNGRLL